MSSFVSRLTMAGLFPLIGTSLALVLYRALLPRLQPLLPALPGPVLEWGGAAALVLLGAVAVWAGARRMAREVSKAPSGLVAEPEAADVGPPWPAAGPDVARVVEVVDRIATEEPPGDGLMDSPGLAAAGPPLRALRERLERREFELRTLFGKLADAMSELGRDVSRGAGAHEAAFLGLLEVVATLRELRQGTVAIAREAEVAAAAGGAPVRRIAEMIGRLDAGLDRALVSLGEVSARLEAEASGSRRLVERGRSLEHDVRGVRQQVERAARTAPG